MFSCLCVVHAIPFVKEDDEEADFNFYHIGRDAICRLSGDLFAALFHYTKMGRKTCFHQSPVISIVYVD